MNVLWIWLQIIIETWDGLIKLGPIINHTEHQLHRNMYKHSEHLVFVMQAEITVPFKNMQVQWCSLSSALKAHVKALCCVQWLANGWSLLLNFLIGPVLSITGEYLQPKGLAVVSHLKYASFALSKLKSRWLTCFSDISCLWIPPPYADFGRSHQGQSAGRDTSQIKHSKTAWK